MSRGEGAPVPPRAKGTGGADATDDPRDDPKYVAIWKDLRTRIMSGEYAPGLRLPSQEALARGYGVTVMTLRQALAELGQEGLVETLHGRGTYVAARPFEYGLSRLSSFAQDVREQGKAVVTLVLSAGLVNEAPPGAHAQLALPAGDQLYLVERLRFVDGRPVVHQRGYLPATVGRRLDPSELERGSLYDILGDRLGLRVVRALETVRAVALPPAEAELLGVPAGAPAFLSTRLSLTAHDRPVMLDRAYLVGDAVEFSAVRATHAVRVAYRTVAESG